MLVLDDKERIHRIAFTYLTKQIEQKAKRAVVSDAGVTNVMPVPANAYHEAGHAVAAVFLGLPVYTATILPDSADDVRHQGPLLRGMLEHVQNVTGKTRDLMERLAIVALAGPHAQKQHAARGYRPQHGALDYDNAMKLAMQVADSSDGARLLLRYWRWRTDDLVRVRRPEIAAVAASLLQLGTLKPMEIRQAIRTTG